MRNMERTILPLDERLKMAAKSQASSPQSWCSSFMGYIQRIFFADVRTVTSWKG